jgi:hypothetical protein
VTKKIFAVKKTTKSARFRGIMIAVVLSIFFIVGAVVIYKKNLAPALLAKNYFSKATLWITQHKKNLQHNLVKVKHMADNKSESEPEIKFEFYTTLPDMQVPLPTQLSQAEPSSTQPIVVKEKKMLKTVIVKNPFDVQTIEKDLAKNMKRKTIK